MEIKDQATITAIVITQIENLVIITNLAINQTIRTEMEGKVEIKTEVDVKM